MIPIEDPRINRAILFGRILVTTLLTLMIAITIYVFVNVPLGTPVQLTNRNSGEPYGMPAFILMLAFPLLMLGPLIGAYKEKPRPMSLKEYYLIPAVGVLFCCVFLGFHSIFAYELLKNAGKL